MLKLWRSQNEKAHVFLVTTLACFLIAFAINIFYVPHNLLSTGISGIAMMFYFFFQTPIGIVSIFFNIPLFIAADRFIGRSYVFNAFYGMILSSLAVDMTTFARNWNVTAEPLLACIYGGVVMGIASGMIFRVNGSTGGTDIIAAICRKYYGINMGTVGFIFNLTVMFFAAFLFNIEVAMYTTISIYISAAVTDKVVAGFNSKKVFLVITEKHQEISKKVLSKTTRGVTYVNAVGAYTGRPKQILYITVTLTQTPLIKQIITEVDPHAFIIIQDAADVLGQGRGFNKLS